LQAFGDIKNILFDREIGTNILSEFINKEKVFLSFLKELKHSSQEEGNSVFDISELINIPAKDGQSIAMKVFHCFTHQAIDEFLNIMDISNITLSNIDSTA
jgi:hypothetical protein